MTYRATYRCPLCNTLFWYGNCVDIPESHLPDLLGKFVANQRFAGNPYLYEAPLYIPHKCRDGSAGLAHFAGFKPVPSESGDPRNKY